ncbi:hypothetical protein DFQ28_006545 [Apophysomyces sp. BC1034]|nr:hypothetical protein DFQ28_006545 [Apophysomyces sp. BC1034]
MAERSQLSGNYTNYILYRALALQELSPLVRLQDGQLTQQLSRSKTPKNLSEKQLKNEKADQNISAEIKSITRCERYAVPRATFTYTEQHNRAVTDTDIQRALKKDVDYGKMWAIFVDDALEDTFIKVKEQLELEKQDEEEDDNDDDAGEEKNQKKQKIDLRTCSIPLEQILRKDLTDEGKSLSKNCVRLFPERDQGDANLTPLLPVD